MSAAPSDCYLVDAHVHLHPGTDPGRVLAATARNMDAAARSFGWPTRSPGMLMLTESAGIDAFAALPESAGDWRIEATTEPVSRIAHPETPGAPIVIVSGRQIVTAEGLEVLALGTRQVFRDGAPIRGVIAEVRAGGALAVLPWGFGKWIGRRGRVVRELITERAALPELFLADTGVRPGFLARPGLLGLAEARGLVVLAGTDPLPFATETAKPGRFGFIACHRLDPERPFAGLVAWLSAQTASPEAYGQLEGALVFFHRQIAMQIRKRLAR